MNIEYNIDGESLTVQVPEGCTFSNGEKMCLSKHFNDITKTKDWYEKGYVIVESEPFLNVQKVKVELTRCISKILLSSGAIRDTEHFKLEDYHNYVSEELHQEIIKKTRNFGPEQFNFKVEPFLKAMGEYFNIDLNWVSSGSYDPKIITRINMPNSKHFNPAHKDIYQVYDSSNIIPAMVNIWIPICGVNKNAGLPVAPGSHLIDEYNIFRTKSGSTMHGQKYNVNCIRDWNLENDMVTLTPNENQIIIFSSFLIHGLARNLNKDKTRMSLEFRLFGENV